MKTISASMKIALCTGALLMAFPANPQAAVSVMPVPAHLGTQNAPLLHTVSAAHAGAEDFVNTVADQGIGFLSDKSLSKEQQKSQFKALLQKNFDMKTIARFALGRHWRTATKEQRAEYLDLFEKMILNVYARRFSEYSGETLNVNGSRAEGESDVLVYSLIQPQSGQAVKVDWRVRGSGNNYKVIDVIVEGVSMTMTQRADFSSVIQRGGGNIEVLLEHLRAQ